MILKQWHSFCLCAEDNTLFRRTRGRAALRLRRWCFSCGAFRCARADYFISMIWPSFPSLRLSAA